MDRLVLAEGMSLRQPLIIMKKSLLTLAAVATAATLLSATPAGAETTTTVESTNSAGTITAFAPDSISIRASAEAAPVQYTATKTTTYVDETGAPVSIETVKSGLPVTVYYRGSGDALVADRVVVRRTTVPPVVEERTTTTTTTTE